MDNMRGKLDDRVALITGASSGIGAATAILFSSLGSKVAMVGRNIDNLKKVAEQCVSPFKYKPLLLLVEDLQIESEVERILKETIDHYGQLDILVNNAGIVCSGGIENTSLQQLDEMYNINLRPVYQLTMLAVPYLIKSKGNIVNVSSVNGLRPIPNMLAYCMSKAALDQFTKCVALELAPKGVRCNSVNPGVIKTELHKRAGMSEEAYPKFVENTGKLYPLGIVGEPQDVAEPIAFLASDQATFMTGVNLSIDGGRSIDVPRLKP